MMRDSIFTKRITCRRGVRGEIVARGGGVWAATCLTAHHLWGSVVAVGRSSGRRTRVEVWVAHSLVDNGRPPPLCRNGGYCSSLVDNSSPPHPPHTHPHLQPVHCRQGELLLLRWQRRWAAAVVLVPVSGLGRVWRRIRDKRLNDGDDLRGGRREAFSWGTGLAEAEAAQAGRVGQHHTAPRGGPPIPHTSPLPPTFMVQSEASWSATSSRCTRCTRTKSARRAGRVSPTRRVSAIWSGGEGRRREGLVLVREKERRGLLWGRVTFRY